MGSLWVANGRNIELSGTYKGQTSKYERTEWISERLRRETQERLICELRRPIAWRDRAGLICVFSIEQTRCFVQAERKNEGFKSSNQRSLMHSVVHNVIGKQNLCGVMRGNVGNKVERREIGRIGGTGKLVKIEGSIRGRVREWPAECSFTAELVECFPAGSECPAAQRVERLIHIELERFACTAQPCMPCGIAHREWFYVPSAAAWKEVCQTIEKWVAFSFVAYGAS
ncbi:uncharacterized protein T551_03205 [Pneumocystis jirovecii RU7]|uniref:Bacteriophage T5 Orf172 DNA-binding domain-containing protein n=1 Tax=Pneumocystis jirovecii (strain RU7) TaxID=1408657 RepID=A0A0W4ZFQ7_PNEJ7|nr:uncharacterized protein T551_03205 [Pneumocystis jirovecii RU7]KTW27211.1 hypothetical protein T551_03205 [Pneumocystis jirovecii RU7]